MQNFVLCEVDCLLQWSLCWQCPVVVLRDRGHLWGGLSSPVVSVLTMSSGCPQRQRTSVRWTVFSSSLCVDNVQWLSSETEDICEVNCLLQWSLCWQCPVVVLRDRGHLWGGLSSPVVSVLTMSSGCPQRQRTSVRWTVLSSGLCVDNVQWLSSETEDICEVDCLLQWSLCWQCPVVVLRQRTYVRWTVFSSGLCVDNVQLLSSETEDICEVDCHPPVVSVLTMSSGCPQRQRTSVWWRDSSQAASSPLSACHRPANSKSATSRKERKYATTATRTRFWPSNSTDSWVMPLVGLRWYNLSWCCVYNDTCFVLNRRCNNG